MGYFLATPGAASASVASSASLPSSTSWSLTTVAVNVLVALPIRKLSSMLAARPPATSAVPYAFTWAPRAGFQTPT